MKNKRILGFILLFPLMSTGAASELDAATVLEEKAAKLMQVVGSSSQSDSSTTEAAKSYLVQEAAALAEEYITSLAPRIEVSIEAAQNNKPRFSILTVQPFYESEDLTHTGFIQGSVFRTDGRSTVNLGLGYRNMSDDKKWLYGINSFYDHEFPYDHGRMSVGFEARSSVFELNANKYFALTDWKVGAEGLDEQALDGYDIEIGAQLPYIPSTKLYAKRFFWKAVDGATDLEGYQYSLNVNAPIMQGMELEAGLRDYDDRESEKFVTLTYKIDLGGNKKSKKAKTVPAFFSNQAFNMTSMEDRRLDKVRRENKIIKQLGFQATVTGS